MARQMRNLTSREKLEVFGPVALIVLVLYLISRYSSGDEIRPIARMALRDHTVGLAEGAALWLGL